MLAKQLQGAAKSAVVDSDFEYTTLLLHGNGTNGAQNNTFLDSSTNNFTITRNGNTTQGTFSPYGDNWSNYFDGTGDYLTVPDNAAFDLGSGDFTIEAWLYITSGNSTGIGGAGWISQWSSGTTQAWYFGTTSGNTFVLGYTTNGTTVQIISSGYVVTTSLNQWVHFAVSKSGTSVKLFVNGVQTGSTGTLSGTIYNSSDAITLGFNQGAGSGWELFGYMSNARVVKGSAVYTANFTPPTAPLTAISGTSLLTCQSNRFIDNSTNAFAITRNGDVSVQRFSPFSPSAAYSASTIGGSGYFDGTGDYLSVPDNNAFSLGTNNFTIEAWIYPTSTGSFPTIFAQYNGTSDSVFFCLGNANTSLLFYVYGTTNITLTAASAITLNTWQHVAAVRNGNTFTVYRNGVSVATNTTSLTVTNSTAKVTVGGVEGASPYPFFGYISNLRVVNGTAVYTAGFTPPTSPVTAITNTQLLCDFTNAGIIDNAMMNDLETVGNAQISTTQSKFGGSSMYFDGTGDYLTIPSSQNFNFGTGNFTVEFWYRTAATGTHTIIDNNYATAPNFTVQPASGSMKLYINGSSTILTESSTHSANVWYHYAFVRSGSTITMYRDGTSVASATYSGAVGNGAVAMYIGGSTGGGGYYVNGYIDDLRITKGVARYTANFTAPTAPFADQ